MSKFSRVMLSCSIALLLVGICYGSLIGQSRRRGVTPAPAAWTDTNSTDLVMMVYGNDAQPIQYIVGHRGEQYMRTYTAAGGGTEGANYSALLGYYGKGIFKSSGDTADNAQTLFGDSFSNITASCWATNVVNNVMMAVGSTNSGNWGSFTLARVGGNFSTRVAQYSGYVAAGDLNYNNTANWSGIHHYASTFDGLTIKSYLDGVEVGSKAYSKILTATNEALFFIGGTGGSTDGTVKMGRWYNRTLTSNEIFTIASDGFASSEADIVSTNNLVLYLPCSNDVTRLADQSDNWNNTLPGPTYANTATRVIVETNGASEVLYGYDFDGVDDRFSVILNRLPPAYTNSLILRTSTFDMSYWVNVEALSVVTYDHILGLPTVGADGFDFSIDATTKKFQFSISDGATTTRILSDNVAPTNSWHHLWGRRFNTNMYFYVDNVLQTNTAPAPHDINPSTAATFFINGGGSYFTPCKGYDVRIYSPAVDDLAFIGQVYTNTAPNNHIEVRVER